MSDSTILAEKVVVDAAEFDIFNSKGDKVKFGSLFENQKTVVVFIRECPCCTIVQNVHCYVYVIYKQGIFSVV